MKKKHLFSLLIAVTMIAVCPLGLWAQTQPKTGDGTSDSPYEIGTADELLWFANRVNNLYENVNAKLIDDIDFTSYANTRIGSTRYSCTFDGNGHKITVSFNRELDDAALFEKLYGTVKNLTVDGTITTSAKFAAGVCAHSYGGTVTGCTSLVDIESTVSGDGTHAGICAVAESGGITIEDCLFAGQINGSSTNSCGGLVGWAGSAPTTISNCLVIATCGVSTTNSNTISRNPGNATITNCYYLNTLGDVPSGATQVTDEQLASGYVAFRLQNNRSNLVWGQNITTDPKDTHPVLGGARVYASNLNCAGLPKSDATFSNDASTVNMDSHTLGEEHAYVAATCTTEGNVAYSQCTVCGKYIDSDGMEITSYIISALGHNYVYGTCERCHALEDVSALKVYTYVQQNDVAVTAVGTASFKLSSSPYLEFVDGKAVLKVDDNIVAQLPMSDDGQLCFDFTSKTDAGGISKTVSNGYATLYSPFQLHVPVESDVEVYAPTYDEPKLRLNDATKVAAGAVIPAGTGLILKKNGTINFVFSPETATDSHESALSGSALKIAKPEESGKTVYTLGHESTTNEFGFFAYSGEYMNPGFAYLLATTLSEDSQTAKYVSFNFGDDTVTEISSVNNEQLTVNNGKFIENGRIIIVKNGQKYNLNGQEVK